MTTMSQLKSKQALACACKQDLRVTLSKLSVIKCLKLNKVNRKVRLDLAFKNNNTKAYHINIKVLLANIMDFFQN